MLRKRIFCLFLILLVILAGVIAVRQLLRVGTDYSFTYSNIVITAQNIVDLEPVVSVKHGREPAFSDETLVTSINDESFSLFGGGNETKEVLVWDIEAGNVRRVIEFETSRHRYIYSVDVPKLNPDVVITRDYYNPTSLGANFGEQIIFWDTSTGERITKIVTGGSTEDFEVSANGAYAVYKYEFEVLVFDVHENERITLGTADRIRTATFHPTENIVFYADGSHVVVYNAESRERTFFDENAPPFYQLEAAGNWLVGINGNRGSPIHAWELDGDGSPQRMPTRPDTTIDEVTFSSSGNFMTVVYYNGAVEIWDLNTRTKYWKLDSYISYPYSADQGIFSERSQLLFLRIQASARDYVEVWDTTTSTLLRTIWPPPDEQSIHDIQLSKHEDLLLLTTAWSMSVYAIVP